MELQFTNRPQLEALAQFFPKAAASALNKMAAQAKTEMGRVVPEIYNVQPKDVKQSIVVFNAYPDRLESRLVAKKGKGSFPLRMFVKGFAGDWPTIEIVRGQQKTVRGVFLATMASGHKGVYVRYGPKRVMKRGRYSAVEGDKYSGIPILRQPIKEKTAMGAIAMGTSERVLSRVVKFVNEKLPAIMEHEIEFFGR